jgi:hypothetical protein
MRHLINTHHAKTLQGIIVYPRPTPWSVFLSGVLHIDKDIAFIDIQDKKTASVFNLNKTVISWLSWPHKHTAPQEHIDALVNSSTSVFCDDKKLIIDKEEYDIVPWSFVALCVFCLESIQHGFFGNYKAWRWCA